MLTEVYEIAGDALVSRELHFGQPAETISRRAAELRAELIVVGTRGLGRIERLMLGSVSAAVAAQAPCSVLVVRPRKKARAQLGSAQ